MQKLFLDHLTRLLVDTDAVCVDDDISVDSGERVHVSVCLDYGISRDFGEGPGVAVSHGC